MSNKIFLCTIIFISQCFLILSSSEDPVTKPKSWEVGNLYKYLNETYLLKNNPNYEKNIRYMIFDPENYCKYGEMEEAYNNMLILYEKYNISTYIFFLSHIKDNHHYKSDEIYESFVDKLNYLIYKDHEDYNENTTLSVVFFIKDRRMRFRTPKNLRKIFTISEALNILNRRKKDLKNNNFQEVANGVAKDIYNVYIRKTEMSYSDLILIYFYLYFKRMFFTILLIIGISLLIFLFSLLNRKQSSKQEDKVKVFLDKLKKRNNAKEIFAESCIICLEEFKTNEDLKKIEISEDKELLEKEEVIVLECGHKFHRKCISDWLKRDESCPFCRMKFDIKGNDSNNKSTNVDFSSILNEILRIQLNRDMLNRSEIGRIRNTYNPTSQSTYNNWRPNVYTSYYSSSSSSSSSHSKSYSSFKRGSGGATSSW